MAGGYVGRYLKINLTSGEIKSVPLNEKDTALFLGGSGLAARWIAADVAAGPDPLGPGNPLVIVTGPAAGTPTPTSNRFAAAARSPLTRLWGEGDCGGRWASALKGAGFDGSGSPGSPNSRSTCTSKTARQSCATPEPCGASTPMTWTWADRPFASVPRRSEACSLGPLCTTAALAGRSAARAWAR